jgi:hypothetical protein
MAKELDSKIDEKMLDFLVKSHQNVLLVGRHGVGKTQMVKDAWERNGLKWKYFSAATMDPWVDFVGVPKEHTTEDGTSFIRLVRPENFHNDTVEAIFMDEFNRSKEKVRNAVMELIQFKSINGIPFKNLKMVWAAINPDDEEDSDAKYDVEVLDPAQRDRFQVVLHFPYKPSKAYFRKKYDMTGVGAVEWWEGLTPEQNRLVSPRRLEYAVQMYNMDGDLRLVLSNTELNLTQLRQRLTQGPIVEKLRALATSKNEEEIKKVFSTINFVTDAIPEILKKEEYVHLFIKYVPQDMVSKLIVEETENHTFVNMNNIIKNSPSDFIAPILNSIIVTGGVGKAAKAEIIRLATEYKIDTTTEDVFLTAINEALISAAGNNTERYHALHSVHGNMYHTASLGTYNKAVLFLATIIHNTTDSALSDNKRPYLQIGAFIAKAVDNALKKVHNTDLMTVLVNIQNSTPSMKTSRVTDRMESLLIYTTHVD